MVSADHRPVSILLSSCRTPFTNLLLFQAENRDQKPLRKQEPGDLAAEKLLRSVGEAGEQSGEPELATDAEAGDLRQSELQADGRGALRPVLDSREGPDDRESREDRRTLHSHERFQSQGVQHQSGDQRTGEHFLRLRHHGQ